ncbi:MAG: sigma-70 family RNA polymerase sigma factor [Segetibacter sp.]|nr:sigma-70 family RNA polymerase sigma factor [Segetibacter sp.]
MLSTDDTELVAGMASGNYKSFTFLYEKYIKSLTHYGLKFTDDINTVRDCLHDIFVSLWSRKEELQIQSSIKSYLIKSVRSSIIQKVKRNKKLHSITSENEEYDFSLSISPEETFLINENNRKALESVQKLLSTLTTKQKEVIYLRYYHDLSFDEIADQLDLSVKACYKLMNRAMVELRQNIPNAVFMLLYLY